MPRVVLSLVTAMCLLFLPGCFDQMNLEDTSLTLMIGLDLDDHNNLIMYESSPVFYKEAKEKSEEVEVKTTTFFDARNQADAILTGMALGGKIQTILLGKRFIQKYKDWFQIFDTLYRTPKQSVTSRVLLVDGDVGDVFHFQPKDKPRLALHMKKLIDTANKRSITVLTNLQELRHQMKDRGITVSISEIKKDKNQIKVTGTSLLDKHGKYVTSLSLEDSGLLLFVQDRIHGEFTFKVPIPKAGTSDHPHTISVWMKKEKQLVDVNYARDGFHFDIQENVSILIGDKNFSDNIESRKSQIEAQIAKALQRKLTALIVKCQGEEIDPFGFGYYARAYQYQAWKSVQDHWVQEFAKAKVHVTPQVEIKSIGVTE